MTRMFFALAFSTALAFSSLPMQAYSAERSGIQNPDRDEFSSRQRSGRQAHAGRLHYYDPYPWWWYPPYIKRARTNYLGWPHSSYPPGYDAPYFGGVAGYPGGFWLHGL